MNIEDENRAMGLDEVPHIDIELPSDAPSERSAAHEQQSSPLNDESPLQQHTSTQVHSIPKEGTTPDTVERTHEHGTNEVHEQLREIPELLLPPQEEPLTSILDGGLLDVMFGNDTDDSLYIDTDDENEVFPKLRLTKTPLCSAELETDSERIEKCLLTQPPLDPTKGIEGILMNSEFKLRDSQQIRDQTAVLSQAESKNFTPFERRVNRHAARRRRVVEVVPSRSHLNRSKTYASDSTRNNAHKQVVLVRDNPIDGMIVKSSNQLSTTRLDRQDNSRETLSRKAVTNSDRKLNLASMENTMMVAEGVESSYSSDYVKKSFQRPEFWGKDVSSARNKAALINLLGGSIKSQGGQSWVEFSASASKRGSHADVGACSINELETITEEGKGSQKVTSAPDALDIEQSSLSILREDSMALITTDNPFRFNESDVVLARNITKRKEIFSRLIIMLVLLVMVILGTGIGLIVALNNGSREKEPTQAPSATLIFLPTLGPSKRLNPVAVDSMNSLKDFLSPSLEGAGDPLTNKASPQFRAFQWLTNEGDDTTRNNKNLVQRFALVTLFYATSGDDWFESRGWLSPVQDECTWSARILCHEDGYIVHLDLKSNGLKGTIPSELSLLTKLESLTLSDNNLKDMIPTSIGALTALKTMILENNNLSGSLPNTIGNMMHLNSLQITANHFFGKIPEELWRLNDLMMVQAGHNDLSGTLSSAIMFATSLRVLQVNNNSLTGVLPSELSHLSHLVEINVNGNLMTGPLDIFENMTRVRSLDLGWNQFSGTIPRRTFISGLRILRLEGNYLSLEMSADFFQDLTSLHSLVLSGNTVLGRISHEIGSLTQLRNLEMSSMNIIGSVPSDIGILTLLTTLNLANNRLNGNIPSEFGLLTGLKRLNISNNTISGTIPTFLGKMKELIELDISQNMFRGSLPTELSEMTRLSHLMANGNLYLNGSVPHVYSSLSKLELLDLGETNIGGHIPVALCTALEVSGLSVKVDCPRFRCACYGTLCCEEDSSLEDFFD